MRIIAACALALFATSAEADGVLLTCTNLGGQNFTGSGGITKPGWSAIAPDKKFTVKLAIANQKWDIIRASGSERHSALGDGCSVGMYPNDKAPLDMLFIVACQDEIETMLFYVRDGQDRLITTTISRAIGSPAGPAAPDAAITETADCHKGD